MKITSVTTQLIQAVATELPMAMATDNDPRIDYLREKLHLLRRIEHLEEELSHADYKASILLKYKIGILADEIKRLDERNSCKNNLHLGA